MDCPRCGLVNPAESLVCDCGYRFDGGPAQVEESRSSFSGTLYWFDIRSLKRDLMTATHFSPRSLYPYVFVTVILWCLPGFQSALSQEAKTFDAQLLIAALLDVAVSLWGIHHVYCANGGDAGKDFLNRIVPLAWVWGWRFLFVIVLPAAALEICAAAFLPAMLPVLNGLVGIVLRLLYFTRLAHHVRDVAGIRA